MDLIKNERVNNLLDIYEPLLTNKQKEIMEMYYIYDLSSISYTNEEFRYN